MNKAEIIHNGTRTQIKLNGEPVCSVTDYQIRKNSAQDSTELVLVMDVSELHETSTE